ncbi:MAG: S1C family serine protease [Clostridiales Family XIII bacterium]|jgi:S1-C subfamily serine protease|nr:S1C family serine protease [Clostridiales Family XIII bacterium]
MKEKKYVSRGALALVVAIAVLLCGATGFGGAWLANYFDEDSAATEIVQTSGDVYTITPTSEDVTVTEAVAKKVLDSVVGITATYEETTSYGYYYGYGGGYGGTQTVTSVGTGMIVDEAGYILTNSHVVNDGDTKEIKVLLSDGREVDGTLLWNDDSIDLAILKIEATGLSPVELGDSDAVTIGSYAAAIGNPLGLDFNGSITQGVVSGLNRSLEITEDTRTVYMDGLIQVDAAINSGNSGGPLLNSRGEVIGVNTAKASAEGMGFAIPINTAKPIIEKVIATGSFERAYMGVSAANASDLAAQYPNLGIDGIEGAFVTAVTTGSPAAEAGLQMKDVITAIDGVAVTGSSDMIKKLLNYSPGDTVTVTYIRNGQEKTVEVDLVSQDEISGTTSSSSSSGDSEDEDSSSTPYDDWKRLFP